MKNLHIKFNSTYRYEPHLHLMYHSIKHNYTSISRWIFTISYKQYLDYKNYDISAYLTLENGKLTINKDFEPKHVVYYLITTYPEIRSLYSYDIVTNDKKNEIEYYEKILEID